MIILTCSHLLCSDVTLYGLKPHQSKTYFLGVAVINGIIYAVGGFNGSLRVRTVDIYDPIKDMWSAVASMEARRSTLGAAVLNGLLYAVGGFDGSSGLNSVEVYDPKSNEWEMVSPMCTRRSSVGVGVVGSTFKTIPNNNILL